MLSLAWVITSLLHERCLSDYYYLVTEKSPNWPDVVMCVTDTMAEAHKQIEYRRSLYLDESMGIYHEIRIIMFYGEKNVS